RRQLGIGDGPFILAIGVLEPRKNLNRLMDAFTILKQRANVPSDLKLVLAGGKGWLFDGIFEHHRDSSVRDDIVLPGFVPDTLLPAMYSAAEVFAFPSLYEGFGLPILEAMACGTAVVASRASCLPEVAEGAALLIDPASVADLADALERVITDHGLRENLIVRGRERAAQYTWQAAAERLLDVYRRVGAA
ncbi:MAG TPA: glycosyltransferase family 1 protein, partial [Chloroflexota bacterium]|nr:glycosyltransferase family 1 protein [Chloroflexota bacterium]